jgi:hypothetical protein
MWKGSLESISDLSRIYHQGVDFCLSKWITGDQNEKGVGLI